MSDFDTNKIRNGSGMLFRNTKKSKEKQPDYTGSLRDNNDKLWQLAGWKKFDKNNQPFLTLALSEPKERKAQEGGDETPF